MEDNDENDHDSWVRVGFPTIEIKETAAAYFTANPILEAINSVITVAEPIDRNYNFAAGLWRTPFKPSKSSRPLPLPTHPILPRLLPGHRFQAQVQEQATSSSLSPVISPSTDPPVLPSTTPALLPPTTTVLPPPPSVPLPISATDAISSALTLKLSFQEITRVVQKYSAKQLQSLAILKEAIEREERESKEKEAAIKRKGEDAETEASAVKKTTKNPPF